MGTSSAAATVLARVETVTLWERRAGWVGALMDVCCFVSAWDSLGLTAITIAENGITPDDATARRQDLLRMKNVMCVSPVDSLIAWKGDVELLKALPDVSVKCALKFYSDKVQPVLATLIDKSFEEETKRLCEARNTYVLCYFVFVNSSILNQNSFR